MAFKFGDMDLHPLIPLGLMGHAHTVNLAQQATVTILTPTSIVYLSHSVNTSK